MVLSRHDMKLVIIHGSVGARYKTGRSQDLNHELGFGCPSNW